jgi:endonuclease YncB( thermonuclease family)
MLLAGVVSPAAAKSAHVWHGPYPATVARVVDGDTLHVVAHVWPGIDVPVSVRLADVDTPEVSRPKCPAERKKGLLASEFVKGAVPPGTHIELSDVRAGKYAGRVVARIFLPTSNGPVSLGQWLVARHLAAPYQGRRKPDWCGGEKK